MHMGVVGEGGGTGRAMIAKHGHQRVSKGQQPLITLTPK